MKINHNGGICIYCNTSGAHDYAIHGRGAGAKSIISTRNVMKRLQRKQPGRRKIMKDAINVMHDLKEICKVSRTCSDCPLNDAGITLCLESPRNWDEEDIQFIVKYSKQIKAIAKYSFRNEEGDHVSK